MTKLFILRPEPGASASADKARALGLKPMVTPLFEVHPVKWIAPDPARFDGLLLTSANAVRHGGDALESVKALPVYAVGEATAAAAREAGFTVEKVGGGNIDDLLDELPAALRLLHPCGFHRRPPINPKQKITSACAYRTKPATPGPEFRALGGQIVVVHSAEAAKRLAELVLPVERRSTEIAAISQQAAVAAGLGWKRVAIAEQPSDDAVLALAARLCDKSRPT